MNPGAEPAALGAALALAAGLASGLAPARLLKDTAGVSRGRWSAELTPLRLSAVTTFAAVASYVVLLNSVGWAAALAIAVASACLVGVFLVDLDRLLIPDLYPAALAVLAVAGPIALPTQEAALGAAVGGGLVWLTREAFNRLRRVEAIGWGDVKLVAALGALTGSQPVLWVVCAGSVIGAVWAWARLRANPGAVSPAPFGAALAAPALAALVLGALER